MLRYSFAIGGLLGCKDEIPSSAYCYFTCFAFFESSAFWLFFWIIVSSFSALFRSPAHSYNWEAFSPAFSTIPDESFFASHPINFRMNLRYGDISKAASEIRSQPSGMNGTAIHTSPTIKISKVIIGMMNFFTSLRYVGGSRKV